MFLMSEMKNQENGNYNAALYLRLSREDDNNVTESESINNQRSYLSEYALNMGFNIYDVYVDDGFTGTDFNRPAFRRMIEDIEFGRVNMVLTKDLSRLGRDYIDTGHYIERYFPKMGVRYIAVNDGVDTFQSNSYDMTPFKAVVNDAYAKDISRKVITTFRLKAHRGDFIGAIPPYGYKKDSANKNKLLPNEDTAYVVKMIFEEYVSGKGYVAISKKLNEMNILSPSMYNKEKYNYTHNNMKFGSWGIDIIRKIVLNPIYIGHMVQHKTEVVNYKVHNKRAVQKDKQIVVKNACEPLVDEELFETAQAMMAKKSNYKRADSNVSHTLSGSMYCGICGARMTFTKCNKGSHKGEFYAICSRYKRYTDCKRITIYEKDLEDVVLNSLKQIAKNYLNKDEILEGLDYSNVNSEAVLIEREIENLKNRANEIQKILKSLYEDKVKGLIDDNMFLQYSRDYGLEKDNIYRKLEESESKKVILTDKKPVEHYEKLLSDILDFNILSKNILIALVERIEINEGIKIVIKYNFSENM